MITYHARRLTNAAFGDGWYIVRRENGIETVLPMYYHEIFPESRFEAEQLAHHLTTRNRSKSKMYIRDNRTRQRANG